MVDTRVSGGGGGGGGFFWLNLVSTRYNIKDIKYAI
jgi:hypothetical protein